MSIWVQLGRSGDILNILPLLYQDCKATGQRQKLMVAREYAPLLEGCGYVDPIIFEGGAQELAKAVAQASATGEKVICTQVNASTDDVRALVYGPAGQDRAVTTSFQKEMWKVAGRLKDWGNYEYPHGQLPLVFDKRVAEREAHLVEFLPKSKKIVLVAADGISSPFPAKALIMELLRARKYLPIDLDAIKAERLFDLIALYEKAFALVAIDSAPLHLAAAVPDLPVCALVKDTPLLWNGSSWKANHIFYCRYGDFVSRAVEMVNTLDNYQKRPASMNVAHVYNAFEETPPIRASVDKHWSFLPIKRGMMGRTNDGHPYLKDCLKMGIQRSAVDGWVVLTRPGLVLGSDVQAAVMTGGPSYAYRLSQAPHSSQYSPVVDFFSAPATFWQSILGKTPDLLLNKDHFWSQALWALFKAEGARDITGIVERPPAAAAKSNGSPSINWNLDLKNKLFEKLGVTGLYREVTKQLDPVAMDTTALPPFSYNPSIGKFEGRIVVTYRYHFAGDMRTRLGMATFKEGRLVDPRDLPISGHSVEDARIFPFRGETWLSWVESDIGKSAEPHCVVKYGKLEHGPKVEEIHQVKVGSNDWSHMQKNWCFFESDENLFCVYRADPSHTVLQIQGPTIINEYKAPAVTWPYGQIRGGGIVAFGDDKLLRFFHSRSYSEPGNANPRYFVGALVMERRPPFKVLQVSRKPILYGSELPNCGKYPYKPRVVFPGTAIEVTEGHWVLAVGINDSACQLLSVSEEDLNL